MNVARASQSAGAVTSGHDGFTLIEVLVSIAIVGILIALLMPAVQMARESARRTQCRNNLRQCALAIIEHEETYGWFPTGGWSKRWVGQPDRGAGREQPGGWIYNILPFVDQTPLHDLGGGDPPDAAANLKRISTPLGLFMCPTRRGPELYRNSRTPLFCRTAIRAARNDYVMNGGHLVFIYGNGPDSIGGSQTFAWPDSSKVTGISYQRSQVKHADISDGTSATYLVAEKHLRRDRYFTGDDHGDNENMYSGDDRDLIRFTGGTLDPSFKPLPDDWITGQEGYIFGSAHTGGFQTALCDGSLRTINYSIDQTVHSRLGNRQDGNVVELN